MKHLPISQRMSALTHSIGDDQSMAEAQRRMHDHRIRHLPVLRGGQLMGIVSERDIALVESLPDVDADRVLIREAMTEQPYTVAPTAELGQVVQHMAQHKFGAALVVEQGHPVGIFTTVDALELAAELLGA